MSMADPFLPEQPGRDSEYDTTPAAEPGPAGPDPQAPEEPDVILPPDGEAAVAAPSGDARIPIRDATFRTPAGDSVDPADD